MEKRKVENQRIRLSKSMLKSGLLRLLKEKPLNEISIYELCQESQINRTTFYKYYGSQMDLLNEIEMDFLTQMNENLNSVIEHDTNALLAVLNHLYEERELFCLLVRSIPSNEFAMHLVGIPSIRLIFQNLTSESGCSATTAKYLRQFVFQGTFSVLYEWLNSENPEPVAEIAEVLGLLRRKL